MLASRYSQLGDPVAMSRVIANSLLSELRSSNGAKVEPLSVINLCRLMQMYAQSSFYSRNPLGILEQDDFADLNSLSSSEGFKRLQAAIRQTHAALSPNSAPSAFASEIAALLSALGNRKGNFDVQRLDTFLSRLSESLTHP